MGERQIDSDELDRIAAGESDRQKPGQKPKPTDEERRKQDEALKQFYDRYGRP